jgi:hypothetical protein
MPGHDRLPRPPGHPRAQAPLASTERRRGRGAAGGSRSEPARPPSAPPGPLPLKGPGAAPAAGTTAARTVEEPAGANDRTVGRQLRLAVAASRPRGYHARTPSPHIALGVRWVLPSAAAASDVRWGMVSNLNVNRPPARQHRQPGSSVLGASHFSPECAEPQATLAHMSQPASSVGDLGPSESRTAMNCPMRSCAASGVRRCPGASQSAPQSEPVTQGSER